MIIWHHEKLAAAAAAAKAKAEAQPKPLPTKRVARKTLGASSPTRPNTVPYDRVTEFLRQPGYRLMKMHTRHGAKFFCVPVGPVSDADAKKNSQHPYLRVLDDGLFPGVPQSWTLDITASAKAEDPIAMSRWNNRERTMNQITKTEEINALTTNDTAGNILAAAQEEAGVGELLKFRKGDYAIGKEAVPLGTEYLAHAAAWTKLDQIRRRQSRG